jgi:hypothetical protein
MYLAETNYPLGNALLTMIVFFGWIMFFWLLLLVYTDLFRRSDIGGWAKTGWVIFTLFLPILGCLVYLIAEGGAMKDRRVAEADHARQEFDAHVRAVPSNGARNRTYQIEQAKELLDNGAITPDEFTVLKQKTLAN